jgi:hypothetical protein
MKMGKKQEFRNLWGVNLKNPTPTLRDCVIAPKTKELIPLNINKSRPENTPLIPLLKEGEMT